MSFSSVRISYFIPDFVEIQRKSFLDLLDKGLIQELYKRNPITNTKQNLELRFYPEYYKLNPPDWTPKECILKSKSYACRLYVPIHLINKATKESKLQWVLLGNLPLMTKRGHFILNGSPRVIINQMVRSPGIYYQQVVHKNKKRTYYADLISHRGAWLRLETDKKRKVWARMKKTPKVSILVFLQALGLSKEKIFQSINYSNFLKSSFLKEDHSFAHPISSGQALQALYFETHPKKEKSEITTDLGQKFLLRKFFNSRTYDLSRLGRIQLNKKLGLSVPLTKSVLTEQDILFATDYLIKLEYGLGTLDDIDDLKNRRVRASGELIQNQLGTGFIRLEKMIREKLKKPRKKLTVRSLITTKPVNGALREFFGSSQLSQFMDQTNPLAELTHKRRLSSLGPGGISRETAGMAVRGIHPSHYGRICPIETPEGPNAGLVNSLTTYAKVNSEGFIETPFYSVYKGQIQMSAGPIFFSAAQEEHVKIAPGDLKLSQLDFLPKSTIPVRIIKEFKRISRNEVEYISISPIQMISIATSLIPFLEHDDANRALMGSNMQRQAVPLIAPERPIVGTGLEGRVAADSGHAIQSRTSGFVSYVSGERITIKNFIEPTLSLVSREGNTTKSLVSNLVKKIKKKRVFSRKSPNSKFRSQAPVYNLLEKSFRSFLKTGKVNSHVQLALNNQKKFKSSQITQEKPFIFRSFKKSQNKLHSIELKMNLSTIKTSPQLKKFSILNSFLSSNFVLPVTSKMMGRDINKVKFCTQNKITKEKKLFEFSHVQNLSRQVLLKEQNFIVNSEDPNTIFRNPSFCTPRDCSLEFCSSCLTLRIDKKQWKTQPVLGKNRNLDQIYLKNNLEFQPQLTKKLNEEKYQILSFKKIIYREISVSKKKRYFLENSDYTKKSFLIRKNILKLQFTSIFNWYHFLFQHLIDFQFLEDPDLCEAQTLENKNFYNNTHSKKQWKGSFKLKFDELQGWNRAYKLSKFSFFDFPGISESPIEVPFVLRQNNVEKTGTKVSFNYKVIGQLSVLDYFSNLKWSSFQSTKHNTYVEFNKQLTKPSRLLEIKTRLSNNLSSISRTDFLFKQRSELANRFSVPEKWKTTNSSIHHQSVNSSTFNIEKNFSLSSINYFLDQYQRSNQDTCLTQRPIVHEGEWVQKGDLLADGTASVGGELSLGKTILVAYMPWEGYNFEDAILISERLIYDEIYTSIHIERYEIEIRDTKFGVEQITNQIPEIEASQVSHLDNRGIAKIGSWIKEGDILVGKITPIQKKSLSPHEKLLYDIVKKEIPTTRDTSLRVPKNVHGRVVNIQILETENIPPEIDFEGPGRVHIYVAEKRKIQVGDKMAGRHGNKGIISKILPRQDMPYLPDGTPVDMVLNPLGVPSRMNVGQVFECLLGLAGKQLEQQFKIIPFDEIHGPEASRSLVYSKLFEARMKTGQKWLFDPNFAGKTKLFDGRTGECFDQAVTVGQAYMLKLVHLVDEKIHARSTGPYSLVTQQPLRGRSKHGGQRLGEMEVWALEGFGAAYILQELLTVKSDDMKGRHQVMDAILNNRPISLGTPESFKVLIRELQSLCLDVGVYTIESSGRRKQIDVMKLS